MELSRSDNRKLEYLECMPGDRDESEITVSIYKEGKLDLVSGCCMKRPANQTKTANGDSSIQSHSCVCVAHIRRVRTTFLRISMKKNATSFQSSPMINVMYADSDVVFSEILPLLFPKSQSTYELHDADSL